MVLCGEDIAAGPGDFSTESGQGFDEDGSLDGHVKATGNSGTGKRLISTVFLSDGHETGHLDLSKLDLKSTKSRQRDVGDLGLCGWCATHDLRIGGDVGKI